MPWLGSLDSPSVRPFTMAAGRARARAPPDPFARDRRLQKRRGRISLFPSLTGGWSNGKANARIPGSGRVAE
jgi:hypothetical protein